MWHSATSSHSSPEMGRYFNIDSSMSLTSILNNLNAPSGNFLHSVLSHMHDHQQPVPYHVLLHMPLHILQHILMCLDLQLLYQNNSYVMTLLYRNNRRIYLHVIIISLITLATDALSDLWLH